MTSTSTIVRNAVGGTAHATTTPATYKVTHPATGDVPHEVERSTAADLKRAIDTAHAALPAWSKTPLAGRKAVLLKAAALLEDSSSGWADKLVKANLAEQSCTPWWASAQIHAVEGALKTLVASADEALEEKIVTEGAATFKIGREPYGVCLAIAAWNAVTILTMRAITTPLLAGNTVVLKTSEMAPLSQTHAAELLYAAGLPHDALVVVHVATPDAAELTPVLVGDKRIRHVNFTGSTRVGSIIAGLAGQHLKPSLMELGGKAPTLILPDADIETAASHILFGAFMNAGQICMSTERIIVPASKHDALVAALRSSWDTVKVKQPRALFQSASGERVNRLFDDAISKGAKPILDQAGKAPSTAFFEPTIIGPVDPSMALYTEESFGPIAVVVTVPDSGRSDDEVIDEMVAIANDTDYGLSAGVWGKDLARAEKVARRMESGAVHVNGPTPADPPMIPHGGWKSSGWGRFNGVEGIRSFTQTRSIELSTAPQPMPLNVFEL